MPLLVKKTSDTPPKVEDPLIGPYKGDFTSVISTGSTWLDLAISGMVSPVGGIPGGIVAEVYGPSGTGKTAVLSNAYGDVQRKGGKGKFLDPEARLDREYAKIFQASLDKTNYSRPDTVRAVFDIIKSFTKEPATPGVPNVLCPDSLAALTTDLELEVDKKTGKSKDKRGQQRAKEFSAGFRRAARDIRNSGTSIVCSNQLRQGDYGKFTPGGEAIGFYASLRIELRYPYGKEGDKFIEKSATLHGVQHTAKQGIKVHCEITKNTCDVPYREAWFWLIFGYGIDDIRGNLQLCKNILGRSVYVCPDGQEYQAMVNAVNYIEKNNLEKELKRMAVKLWREREEALKVNRKPKVFV